MYYKLEDIKGVDRNRYSKDIQYGHTERPNIDLRNNTQKQNIEQHEPHIKPGVNGLLCSGRGSRSCSINGVRRIRGTVIYYLAR